MQRIPLIDWKPVTIVHCKVQGAQCNVRFVQFYLLCTILFALFSLFSFTLHFVVNWCVTYCHSSHAQTDKLLCFLKMIIKWNVRLCRFHLFDAHNFNWLRTKFNFANPSIIFQTWSIRSTTYALQCNNANNTIDNSESFNPTTE